MTTNYQVAQNTPESESNRRGQYANIKRWPCPLHCGGQSGLRTLNINAGYGQKTPSGGHLTNTRFTCGTCLNPFRVEDPAGNFLRAVENGTEVIPPGWKWKYPLQTPIPIKSTGRKNKRQKVTDSNQDSNKTMKKVEPISSRTLYSYMRVIKKTNNTTTNTKPIAQGTTTVNLQINAAKLQFEKFHRMLQSPNTVDGAQILLSLI